MSEMRYDHWDNILNDLLNWHGKSCGASALEPLNKYHALSTANARQAIINHCERLKNRCKRLEQHGIL